MTNTEPAFSGYEVPQACGCIGPQNGEPLCPCAMRRIIQRNGRWIKPEEDLGPVLQKSEKKMEIYQKYTSGVKND